MRCTPRFAVASAITIASAVSGGCVDGFRGSNVQLDLSPGTPVQAHVIGAQMAGELPASAHFTLYGIQERATEARLFELQRFEVHRLVDLTSPCFIDVGDHVPHPGLHVSMYAKKIAEDTGIADLANPPPTATEDQRIALATAMQRMIDVQLIANGPPLPINAVTSASTSVYPAMAADCSGPVDQLPPPACMDDASNQRRLQLCQAAWQADPSLFEGTDRVLTDPLNGIINGMVDGRNPVNLAPVGGAQFFVDQALDNIDAYAIYTQIDGVDAPGTQLLFGRPTLPTRGVLHVHLEGPGNPALTAEMAVFIDLGQDDVHF
ncbi:MAG TPA: hypothetical protein VHN14_10280 [Kofleriaceae bacterium]|nr:hypothetical protein [Kofleriaceae bacterium]